MFNKVYKIKFNSILLLSLFKSVSVPCIGPVSPVGLVSASPVGLVSDSPVGLVSDSPVGLVSASPVGLVSVSQVGLVSSSTPSTDFVASTHFSSVRVFYKYY